jgi:hypothetical protein
MEKKEQGKEKTLIFNGYKAIFWNKIPCSSREFDALALLEGMDVGFRTKSKNLKPKPTLGYLKFTGPNVVEVEREADKSGLPAVPFQWWKCVHNDVEENWVKVDSDKYEYFKQYCEKEAHKNQEYLSIDNFCAIYCQKYKKEGIPFKKLSQMGLKKIRQIYCKTCSQSCKKPIKPFERI